MTHEQTFRVQHMAGGDELALINLYCGGEKFKYAVGKYWTRPGKSTNWMLNRYCSCGSGSTAIHCVCFDSTTSTRGHAWRRSSVANPFTVWAESHISATLGLDCLQSYFIAAQMQQTLDEMASAVVWNGAEADMGAVAALWADLNELVVAA